MQFLRMYEDQAEKMRKEISSLAETTKVLQGQVEELEEENSALTKGEMMPKNSSYWKRDDGLMSMKVRGLEEANMQL